MHTFEAARKHFVIPYLTSHSFVSECFSLPLSGPYGAFSRGCKIKMLSTCGFELYLKNPNVMYFSQTLNWALNLKSTHSASYLTNSNNNQIILKQIKSSYLILGSVSEKQWQPFLWDNTQNSSSKIPQSH